MRNIPAELVSRYEGAGWWTHETLGQVLADGLHRAPDAASVDHRVDLDAPEDKRLLTGPLTERFSAAARTCAWATPTRR
jgi:non-ribosomal peptide synthetase component E (peptide arylation enzyme)